MVNFEPLKHEKDNFSVSGTRGSEKSRTYDFLVTSADALPLSTNYNFHSYLNVAASFFVREGARLYTGYSILRLKELENGQAHGKHHNTF